MQLQKQQQLIIYNKKEKEFKLQKELYYVNKKKFN